MADNPQLTSQIVHDVNHDPVLPLDDGAFDAVVCAVSIQYVLHPVRLFREVERVLRPAAPFVVSFSNRCFPTKAIAAWLYANDRQHCNLVRRYFEESACWRAQGRASKWGHASSRASCSTRAATAAWCFWQSRSS